MSKFQTTQVSEILLSEAKKVRNEARSLDKKSECDVRRTERARFLLNSGKVAFYMTEGADAWASCTKDAHYTLLDKEGATCTCPDRQKGNLCKHVRVLAASVIEHAASLKVKQAA